MSLVRNHKDKNKDWGWKELIWALWERLELSLLSVSQLAFFPAIPTLVFGHFQNMEDTVKSLIYPKIIFCLMKDTGVLWSKQNVIPSLKALSWYPYMSAVLIQTHEDLIFPNCLVQPTMTFSNTMFVTYFLPYGMSWEAVWCTLLAPPLFSFLVSPP